jgi:hypothetical protein
LDFNLAIKDPNLIGRHIGIGWCAKCFAGFKAKSRAVAGADDGSGFDVAARNFGAVMGADIFNGEQFAIRFKKGDLDTLNLKGHMFAFSEHGFWADQHPIRHHPTP